MGYFFEIISENNSPLSFAKPFDVKIIFTFGFDEITSLTASWTLKLCVVMKTMSASLNILLSFET